MHRTAIVLSVLTGALLLAPGHAAGQRKPESKDDEPEPCTSKPGRLEMEGVVLDSLSSVPIEGAGVAVRWRPDPRNSYEEEKEGETDHQGRFRVCDIPPGMAVTVLAGFWGQRSREREAVAGDPASADLVLIVDGPHSTLVGHVLDASGGAPVAGASVKLEGIPDVQITGADGGFRFGRVPPKSYEVQVTHLAYTTLTDTLDVDVATSVDATIRVSPGVIALEPITVVVRSLVLERAGFYDRQGRGNGHYVTRQQIEVQRPLQSSELLRRVPSVRLVRGRDGLIAVGRSNCPFRYVVDGVRAGPDFSIDLVSTGDIEGMEVYLGPSQVPGEFNGLGSDVGGTCGVIVVWTRRHVKI